jgi:hypothetical protein
LIDRKLQGSGMNQRTKKGLKLAAAVAFAVLLVAITFNVAVDFWTPQAELKDPVAPKEAVSPAIEPTSLQVPLATRPLPAPPLPQRPTTASAQPPWNEPLFEPKFDGPAAARGSSGGAQTFSAPDFGKAALNQFAPLSQVLPPSVSVPGSNPTGISIRPIFSGKSGGVESGGLGAADGVVSGTGSTVSGAASSASTLLKR